MVKGLWAYSSVVRTLLSKSGNAGSNPVMPTNLKNMKKTLIVLNLFLLIQLMSQDIKPTYADTIEIPNWCNDVSYTIPVEKTRVGDEIHIHVEMIKFSVKGNSFIKNGKTYFILPRKKLEREIKKITKNLYN